VEPAANLALLLSQVDTDHAVVELGEGQCEETLPAPGVEVDEFLRRCWRKAGGELTGHQLLAYSVADLERVEKICPLTHDQRSWSAEMKPSEERRTASTSGQSAT
jgi:hypothetical protein